MSSLAHKAEPDPIDPAELIAALTELYEFSTKPGLRPALKAAEMARRYADDVAGDLKASILLLQILDNAMLVSETAPKWEALYRANPDHPKVIRHLVSSFWKRSMKDEAMAIIDRHYPADSDDRRELARRAALYDAIYHYDDCFALFRKILAAHPDYLSARLDLAVRLAKVGFLVDALEVLEPAADEFAPDSRGGLLLVQVRHQVECLERLAPGRAKHGEDCRLLALECLLRFFENRPLRPTKDPQKISLVTGGLGAGGAERQLSKLACLLAENLGSPDLVSVAVKTLGVEHKPNDHFLPDLLDNGIEVVELEEVTPTPVSDHLDLDPDMATLCTMLPPQVNYGATRLTSYFLDRDFDVASIWQDGATLYGALAALLAGVPKIHLVFRGQPPIVRTDRNQPEYEILYRAMARIPGVTLISNSSLVGNVYADWLDLPSERVRTLYNAVSPCVEPPLEEEIERWERFVAQTADAETTIGGVFRLEHVKQPLPWVELAAVYSQRYPASRFVLVGDGRARGEIEELIAHHGLTDRVLMVGRSRSVGYWYEKMDVKVLLSRFEGLPNVLIEAQAAGLPVVATPAGGSVECFIEGETGHVLDCTEKPDLVAASEKVHRLAKRFQADPTASDRARDFVGERFSDEQSLRTFLHICST
ncbi:glycosyltransferase [Alteraurantiacibacter aquimixticola]|uniref:Glycosyltransferase n=1 Tax=Alteraurantiacibacter aquimixticola TaxID=2489173 RepID=A0A4T3F5D2_9SPHN|nr:glycosyltransferase [Alteraurantiacibacter aquimixticola]TIX50708.1 glycosyltransferase [Alteraurantiacibacter aquimixticola]